MAKKPYVAGGLALLFGYCWAALRRVKRPVSNELMRFHRREQMKKLGALFRSLFRLKTAEKFSLAAAQRETR
jgi:hypothetical protein